MKFFIKIFFIVILLAVVLFPLMSRAQFFLTENPLIGEPAVDFTLENLKGEKKSLAELRDGGNAIVFFWTTWCPHCREQISQLKTNKEIIEKKNIKLILVNLGESVGQVNAYLTKNHLTFDVLFDVSGSVAEVYNVMGVPTYVLINQEGVVKAIENVLMDDYEDIFLNEEK